jgi:hypothetical protein
MAGKGVEGEDLVVPWRKVFMKEETINQMRKEMWEGIHFEERSGEVINANL